MTPIDFLDAELNKIRQTFESKFFIPASEIPKILYHYTSSDGLFGIIKEHCLHANNTNFMSDYMEIRYGQNVVKDVFMQLEKEQDDFLELKFLQWARCQNSDDYNIIFSTPPSTEIFISCFSEQPNLLSQWRAYSGHGQGFSIGFKTESLQKSAVLFKVNYDIEDQHSIIRNLLELTFKAFTLTKANFNITDNEFKLTLFQECLNFIIGLLILPYVSYKDPGFKEEQEWRLVAIRYSDDPEYLKEVSFKSTKHGIVPYIRLDFSTTDESGNHLLPIEKIICGPAYKPDLAKKYIKQLLEQHGYRNQVEVTTSNIPFRP